MLELTVRSPLVNIEYQGQRSWSEDLRLVGRYIIDKSVMQHETRSVSFLQWGPEQVLILVQQAHLSQCRD